MKKIYILAHSENPPTSALHKILNTLGLPHALVRTPFGEEYPDAENVGGLIILGAAGSMTNAGNIDWIRKEMEWVRARLEEEIPTFGICFGCQMLAQIYGGRVTQGNKGREFGYTTVAMEAEDALFGTGLDGAEVFQAHGDTYTLPKGATRLISGTVYADQAAKFAPHVYGVQFHPEITADIVQRWHQFGLDNDMELPQDIPATPEKHAAMVLQKQPVIHAWLEEFLAHLFEEQIRS